MSLNFNWLALQLILKFSSHTTMIHMYSLILITLCFQSDRDVDFTLNCTTFAYVNITYKTSKSSIIYFIQLLNSNVCWLHGYNNICVCLELSQEEKEYTSLKPCQYIRTKFEHKNHGFGGKENTTFYVYVYNFKTPFTLQVKHFFKCILF